MSERIADELGRMKHSEEIAFFNRLLIDLHDQILGRKTLEPINEDRIIEAGKHLDELMKCREIVRFK